MKLQIEQKMKACFLPYYLADFSNKKRIQQGQPYTL